MRVIVCAVVLLSAATVRAQADLDRKGVCDDLLAECDDGCTLDHGTSFQTRDKLATCREGCVEARRKCRDRYHDASRSELNPSVLDIDAEDHDGRATPSPSRYQHYLPSPTTVKGEPSSGSRQSASASSRSSPDAGVAEPRPSKKKDVSEWNPDD